MLIVCPSCESRFELPENVKFTPLSKFKCTRCSHIWKPLDENEVDIALEEDKPSEEPLPKTPDDFAQDVVEDTAQEVLPRLKRQKNLVDELLLPKEKLATTVQAINNPLSAKFLMLAFAPILTFILLLVFHQNVINQIPVTSKLYGKIGLNYELKKPLTFKIENVQYKNIKTPEGEPLLLVAGDLINTGSAPQEVPEIHMIPKTGPTHLAVASIKWEKHTIAPKEKTTFKALMPSDLVPEKGDMLRFE